MVFGVVRCFQGLKQTSFLTWKWAEVNCLWISFSCRRRENLGFKVKTHNRFLCWNLPILLICANPVKRKCSSDVQSVNIYSRLLQPSNTKRNVLHQYSWALNIADVIGSVSVVFLCSGKPCSRAVNILSPWYARRLLMWDLILPVLLRRLSFMSLHLFMVTSAWTHQSCARRIYIYTAVEWDT